MSSAANSLGVGIYSRADAARLLHLSPSRLRRWVGGYTYWLKDHPPADSRRRQPPVIKTDLPAIDSHVALSFLELMELRVVKSIVDTGVSLQHVRSAARVAASRFSTHHPFASRRVFSDGVRIFSAISGDIDAPDVVKWTAAEIDQVISGGVFEQFLSEIEFDESTALAFRWWPLGRGEPVVLDPAISFGAPVVEGTGVRTTTVAGMAELLSHEEAAVAYEIELRQVAAAVAFETQLAAA